MATLASRLNARTQSNVQLRMLPINETTQIPCHPSSSPVHFSSFFSTFDDRWSRICQKINRLLQKQLGYYELSFFAILLRRQSPLGNRLRSFSKFFFCRRSRITPPISDRFSPFFDSIASWKTCWRENKVDIVNIWTEILWENFAHY